MEFMGIGLGELFLIMVLALVVIGPEKLPEVAAQVGRTMAELRQQASTLTEEFQQSLQLAAEERKQQRLGAGAAPALPPAAPVVTATGPYCPQCGVRSLADARFCSSCGARLGGPPAAPPGAGAG